eukprot:Opistho-2@38946
MLSWTSPLSCRQLWRTSCWSSLVAPEAASDDAMQLDATPGNAMSSEAQAKGEITDASVPPEGSELFAQFRARAEQNVERERALREQEERFQRDRERRAREQKDDEERRARAAEEAERQRRDQELQKKESASRDLASTRETERLDRQAMRPCIDLTSQSALMSAFEKLTKVTLFSSTLR